MKKSLISLFASALLVVSMGCSNWNRVTPSSMDNKAIEGEIVKNLTADHLGDVNVEVHEGMVTLTGHAKNASDRQKAVDDARKVNGVKSVNDQIAVP